MLIIGIKRLLCLLLVVISKLVGVEGRIVLCVAGHAVPALTVNVFHFVGAPRLLLVVVLNNNQSS